MGGTEPEGLPENDVRRGDVSDGDEEEAVVEGEREQPEARAEEEGHCGEDVRGAESSGELQLAQTLRQQRGLEGSLHRSWLDRRRGWHHLSQGFFYFLFFSCCWPRIPYVSVCGLVARVLFCLRSIGNAMRLGYVGLWVDHDLGRNGLFSGSWSGIVIFQRG